MRSFFFSTRRGWLFDKDAAELAGILAEARSANVCIAV